MTLFCPEMAGGLVLLMATKLKRRQFITMAVVAASGGAGSCARSGSPWRFFTTEEATTVTAIVERIIPADQDPGARWAEVTNYIDLQLDGYYKKLRNTYRAGIAAVEQTSRRLYGKGFTALTVDQQTALLSALEKNKAPADIWKQVSAASFFAMIVDHTMQGFYGSPRHGGNRDGMSYKMLGLPYPPVRGRQHYDFPEST